ncbi:MAG: adenylosuccinate synthase [Anaerolineae bacterium]
MSVKAVVGAQWGDEGKGRVIDYLAQQADMVIRFQGGDNAGHTVIIDKGTFKLHLIPSGIFNPDAVNLIGSGCVVNPDTVLEEMAALKAAGVDTQNLFISNRAQITMPYHRQLDGLQEAARKDNAIGTTKRGIGPAYADKGARRGLRMGDLLNPAWLGQRLRPALENANREITHLGGEPLVFDDLYAQCMAWSQTLSARIVDTLPLVRRAFDGGQSILLEGQLGAMRDLDWGIYPYVTSSNPTAGFAATGAGLPPYALTDVYGVVKAYSTAVGEGPFPTELLDDTGAALRRRGGEYGATTGRPRRCGWFDGVAIGYASWLNGFSGLAVTKLDVLDGLPELKICTRYRLPDGTEIDYLPDTPILETVAPVFETWPGWQEPTATARRWNDLPANAQHYLRRIEELAGAPIAFVSVGPQREAMIRLNDD